MSGHGTPPRTTGAPDGTGTVTETDQTVAVRRGDPHGAETETLIMTLNVTVHAVVGVVVVLLSVSLNVQDVLVHDTNYPNDQKIDKIQSAIGTIVETVSAANNGQKVVSTTGIETETETRMRTMIMNCAGERDEKSVTGRWRITTER